MKTCAQVARVHGHLAAVPGYALRVVIADLAQSLDLVNPQPCAQVARVHGHLAAVPGRALGAVIAGLAAGLPADAHAALTAFHTDVVATLRVASGGGSDLNLNPGPGDAAASQEALAARLPALRALAGVGDAPRDTTAVECSRASAGATPCASGKPGAQEALGNRPEYKGGTAAQGRPQVQPGTLAAGTAGASPKADRNVKDGELAKAANASDSAVEQQDHARNEG